MNPAPDSEHPPHAQHPAADYGNEGSLPSNWREALAGLLVSRFTLIRLEFQEAAGRGAKAALLVVAAIVCVFFTWTLVLAGGIAALSHATGWPWFWIALVTAGLHLLAAIVLLMVAKAPGPPPFPVTRSEFQKDREWIENLQKSRKSNG